MLEIISQSLSTVSTSPATEAYLYRSPQHGQLHIALKCQGTKGTPSEGLKRRGCYQESRGESENTLEKVGPGPANFPVRFVDLRGTFQGISFRPVPFCGLNSPLQHPLQVVTWPPHSKGNNKKAENFPVRAGDKDFRPGLH